MISDTPEEKQPSENIVGKEKMVVTSIFSFSHNVFYRMKDKVNVLSLISSLQMLSIWTKLKSCCLVKGNVACISQLHGHCTNPWFLVCLPFGGLGNKKCL